MDFQEVMSAADEVKSIKLFVCLNGSDGAYVETSKTKFKDTMQKSQWMLDGYGAIDAHVSDNTLFVG